MQLLVAVALTAMASLPSGLCDLRQASYPNEVRRRRDTNEPKTVASYKVHHLSRRRQIPFNATYALYIEPSDFEYEGLKTQREKAYDNFLRSNIDNEQDRRNILTEKGRDHLPFRSWEGQATDAHSSHEMKIPTDNGKTPLQKYCTQGDGDNHGRTYRWFGNNAAAVGDQKSSINNCSETCLAEEQCMCWSFDPRTDSNHDNHNLRCYLKNEHCHGKRNDNNLKHGNCHHYLGPYLQVTPNKEVLIPLRWNNPHSAELEVNIWIMNTGQSIPIVVPVMKPSCSGEGYQDQAFTFKVPNDFNRLGRYVKGFKGCKNKGDCVLQIYAHSVEPRMYSSSVPLFVDGELNPTEAVNANTNNVKNVDHADLQDPAVLGVAKLETLCLSRADEGVHWTSAQPQQARLISDQWNWAYQNSDYSPYSGQQPKYISKNLQSSVVLAMLPGNRGALGIHALYRDCRDAQGRVTHMCFHKQRELLRKADTLKHNYERIAKTIINMVLAVQKNNDTIAEPPAHNHMQKQISQTSEYCFRCKEVGSTTTNRQDQRTYIPSFRIKEPTILAAVQILASAEYSKVLDNTGLVQIYYPAMMDLMEEFRKIEKEYNISYQGPAMKTSMGTKPDSTNYMVNSPERDDDKAAVGARVAYKAEGRRPYGNNVPAPLYGDQGPTPMSADMAAPCPYNDWGTCMQPASKDAMRLAEPLGSGDMHGLDEDADCEKPDRCVEEDNCNEAAKDVSEAPCQTKESIGHLFKYEYIPETLEKQDLASVEGPCDANTYNCIRKDAAAAATTNESQIVSQGLVTADTIRSKMVGAVLCLVLLCLQ